MKKSKKKKLFRRIKLSTLFFLMITLATNSFAWFVYSTKVSTNIGAKVREWKVSFDVNGAIVDNIIQINVDSLYPGMDNYEKILKVSNSGESAANLSYEVVSATVLGEDVKALGLSDADTINYLRTNYPFSINFVVSNNTIQSQGEESAKITVSWPYESGNDEADTLWGNKAYDYHKLNPDVSSINIQIKLKAYQGTN